MVLLIKKIYDLTQKKNISNFKSIAESQINLIRKLEKKNGLEKTFFDVLKKKIKALISENKLDISPKQFRKLLRTKHVEENILYVFKSELEELRNAINLLKSLFESQLLSLSIENALTAEKESVENLVKIMNITENKERKIRQYFADVSRLPYTKRYVKEFVRFTKIFKSIRLNIDVKGLENIPPKGPVIIASRHYHSKFDSFALKSSIPRHLFLPVSVSGFIRMPLRRKWLEKIGFYPIKRDEKLFGKRLSSAVSQERIDSYPSSNLKTYLMLLTHLKNGDAVLIFPEGDAKIGSHFEGINGKDFIRPLEGYVHLAVQANLKLRVNVPIIPVGLNYSGKNYTDIKVSIGKPVYIEGITEKTSKIEINAIVKKYSDNVFEIIKSLSINN